MTANLMTKQDAIAEYIGRVSAGLKGLSEQQRQEILAEIGSHVTDRAEMFRARGSLHPEESAIAAMGNADELARQFARTIRDQQGSRSYAPWILLRRAASAAFTGFKGLLAFLMGVFGYGVGLGFSVAALLKLIMPSKVGFWVGPQVLVWGATSGRGVEVAGKYFLPISLVMGFAFASVTTIVLRWLMRPELSLDALLKHLTVAERG